MTWEENREFSADQHGIVRALADHYVGVGLDYWQLKGKGEKKAGPFLRKYGVTGMDTAGQFITSPAGELLGGFGRCWKNRCGYPPRELLDYAAKYPSDEKKKNLLKLSWFLADAEYYRNDIEDDGAWRRFCSAENALTQARERRRPLARVDGAALALLEDDQDFLRRHVRQFWWVKGDPQGPSRIVVHHSHDLEKGRAPKVLGSLDLSGGLDLAQASPPLDEAWRQYMETRPENITHHAGNPSYRKETEVAFKAVDDRINRLAKAGKILAPGGRPLFK